MKTPVVLLVDDEDSIVYTLKGSLEDEGYTVLTCSNGMKAVEIIKSQPVDIVFLDIWMPEMDGLSTLKAIKDFSSHIEVVMMTGHGTVNTAVMAIREGAFDFLEKPFSLDSVIDLIGQIIKKKKSSAANGEKDYSLSDEEGNLVLTGKDQNVVKIKGIIPKLARSDHDLLITGKVGTGKEFLARLIHASSNRKPARLRKINCSFYAPQKLEAALFGSLKSKACGKKSILYNSKDSTLFLDSVDALSPEARDRLALVITHPELKGSNVRIIAAVDGERGKITKDKKLDKKLVDAFPRIIEMPALKNRREDIPLLLDLFLKHYCKDYGFKEKHIEDDALEILVNYDWPGNVKELKNLVEKMVVSVPTRNITAHDIPSSIRSELQYGMDRYFEKYDSMEEAEAAWRKNYLLHFLRKHNKNLKQTALELSLGEDTLKRYISDYGIVLKQKTLPERRFQRTLKRSIVLGGTGLHSGNKTGLILTPMPPHSGVVFSNISSGETVPADIDYVVSTSYATCLKNENTNAYTIEHLLATLHAYRISNLMIKINNEVPIMDGSALDFCQLIEDAGIEDQDEIQEEFCVEEKYVLGKVKKNKKFITIEPADKLTIHYILQYPKPVGVQEYTFVLNSVESFKKEIAPARTFGFVKDVGTLEKMGLAGGGRLSNLILIDDEKIINTDLRFPDEFVRHKILDMMGDLFLFGQPIIGKITANMTGHSENAEFLRLLRKKRGREKYPASAKAL